ncbi:zinc ribbon domain-containing protein [Citrobacter amalonaticus]|uniref:zinc ribbon domain-containing protein n=1 Tax=Citrobacter amalonaticus TaxID=35703 RepID=UPI0011AFAB34|nr:zinc ribbon domain-containing protein [Citrobacter amalonaticus]
MELIIFCAILGCIPAAIAKSKGRGFFGWWLYGALLFLVALIHSLIIKKNISSVGRSQLNEGLLKCPFCAEMIKPEAAKCKHCGSDVEARPAQNKLIDISGFVVITNLSGHPQLDDFKVKALAKKIKAANVDRPNNTLIADYQPQLDVIARNLPKALRGDFRERISYWLSKNS